MKRIAVLFTLIPTLLWTQKGTTKVHGTYADYAPIHLTPLEAKNSFIENARRNAMTEAFGLGVVSTHDQSYSNWKQQNGVTTDLSEQFFTQTDVYSSGTWIRDTKAPECTQTTKENRTYLSCEVWGEAQKIERATVQFETYTLNCTDLKKQCQTTTFDSEDPFYLYFKSPVNGYLAVYVQYDDTVQQLLPYSKMSGRPLEIIHDQDYLFFSKEHPPQGLPLHLIDEFEVYTDQPLSVEKIITVFSEQSFDKPLLETDMMPPYTNAKKFGKWVQQLIALNPTTQIDNSYYKISKK